MKKILIGAILASSLAMSGDVVKCSHALKEYIYWSDRASDFKSLTPAYTEMVKKEAKQLTNAFRKEIVAQCKNILEESKYIDYRELAKTYDEIYKEDKINFDY